MRLPQGIAHGRGVTLIHHRRDLDLHAHQGAAAVGHAARDRLDLLYRAVQGVADSSSLASAEIVTFRVELRERIGAALQPTKLPVAAVVRGGARRAAHDGFGGLRPEHRAHRHSGDERDGQGDERSQERGARHQQERERHQKLSRRKLAGSEVLSWRIVASRCPSVVR